MNYNVTRRTKKVMKNVIKLNICFLYHNISKLLLETNCFEKNIAFIKYYCIYKISCPILRSVIIYCKLKVYNFKINKL